MPKMEGIEESCWTVHRACCWSTFIAVAMIKCCGKSNLEEKGLDSSHSPHVTAHHCEEAKAGTQRTKSHRIISITKSWEKLMHLCSLAGMPEFNLSSPLIHSTESSSSGACRHPEWTRSSPHRLTILRQSSMPHWPTPHCDSSQIVLGYVQLRDPGLMGLS